jgi:hypothetical protein
MIRGNLSSQLKLHLIQKPQWAIVVLPHSLGYPSRNSPF